MVLLRKLYEKLKATSRPVHFFIIRLFACYLISVFGKVQLNVVHHREASCASGYLELENARVRWFLSVDETHLPEDVCSGGQRTYRSITVDGKEIEFSGGFTDLHTLSFQDILDGNGFGLQEARPGIEAVHHIRNADVVHPFMKK